MRSVFPDSDPVWIAQERLAKLGYLDPDIDLDGKIGPRTRRALVKFQSEHGLSATGDLDPVTATELEAKTWIDLSRASFAVALPQEEEVNRPEPKRPAVERLPGETDADYERRRQAMRDFVFHPSTPKKSTPRLEPEPGFRKEIPPGSVHLRGSELISLNAAHPEARWLTIEYQPGTSDRFTLRDERGLAAASGNDPGDMVGHAIEKIGKTRAGVVIGFKGFTEKEIHAFSAELNVKQELRDGSTAWRPILNADGNLRGLYQERGMKIDGVILDQPRQGWWRARARFSNANRTLWVRTALASAGHLKEYVASLLRSNSSGINQSAQEMVEKSKRQLMGNHPELTEKQIYMSIREEIRQSHLGEMASRRQEAA